MRAGSLLMLVAAAACEGKASKSRPAPSPEPPAHTDGAADECKRTAQDAITTSDIAISKALDATKLELFAPQFLPTPFDDAPRRPDPAEDKRRADARAPFTGKHTGEVVTWMNAGQAVTGIYIEPAKEGWLVVRKGNQIFAAKPATWREITCPDPRAYDGGCLPGPSPLLFALPAGTTFGGTLELPAERVALRLTGGPKAPCPP